MRLANDSIQTALNIAENKCIHHIEYLFLFEKQPQFYVALSDLDDNLAQ